MENNARKSARSKSQTSGITASAPTGLNAVWLDAEAEGLSMVAREIALIAMARGFSQESLAKSYNAAVPTGYIEGRATGATVSQHLHGKVSAKVRDRYTLALGLSGDHLQIADPAKKLSPDALKKWEQWFILECEGDRANEIGGEQLKAQFAALKPPVRETLLRAYALGTLRDELDLRHGLRLHIEVDTYPLSLGLAHMIKAARAESIELRAANPQYVGGSTTVLASLYQNAITILSHERAAFVVNLAELFAKDAGHDVTPMRAYLEGSWLYRSSLSNSTPPSEAVGT